MRELILQIREDATKEEIEELKTIIEDRTDIVSIIDGETARDDMTSSYIKTIQEQQTQIENLKQIVKEK